MTLKSGLTVTLCRVPLLDLAAQGEIPETLQAKADEMLNAKTTSVSISDFPKYRELIEVVVKACLVTPQLVETLDEVDAALKR